MDFNQLITRLQELDSTLKLAAGKTTSMALTCRNWFAGASIVEFEQQGEKRAEYGKKLISTLAKELSINGLNARNLEASRQLYLHYPQLIPQTSAKLTDLLRRTRVKQQQTLGIRSSFAPSEQHLLTSLTHSRHIQAQIKSDRLPPSNFFVLHPCQQSDVPFFFKQWDGRNKKATGRTLEGEYYGALPIPKHRRKLVAV